MSVLIKSIDNVSMRDLPRLLGRFTTGEFPAALTQLSRKLQISTHDLLSISQALANSSQRTLWTDLLRDGRCFVGALPGSIGPAAGFPSQVQLWNFAGSGKRLLVHLAQFNGGGSNTFYSGSSLTSIPSTQNFGQPLIQNISAENHQQTAQYSSAAAVQWSVGVASILSGQLKTRIGNGLDYQLLGSGSEEIVYELAPGNGLLLVSAVNNVAIASASFEWAEVPDDASFF